MEDQTTENNAHLELDNSVPSMNVSLSKSWFSLGFVLLAALLLRLLVLGAYQRDYPLYEDFFIYYDIALNWLSGKGPVLGFLYNYLYFPNAVFHVEDYYEPFYSLVLAGVMLLTGKSFLGSLMLPLFSSMLAVGVTYWGCLRLGVSRPFALAATCLAAVHPLLIERASWLMKESLMGLLYLLLWIWMMRSLSRFGHREAVLTAIFTIGIGMIQYESMLILGSATFLTLLLMRVWKPACIYAGSLALLLLSYWGWFYWQSGLIVSTKYLFLLTPYTGAPFEGTRSLNLVTVIAKLQGPFLYIYRSCLAFVGLPLLLIAGRGLWLTRKHWSTRWLLVMFGAYLFFHGVAVDLWFQDFLVCLLLLFPYAALALQDWYLAQTASKPWQSLWLWLVVLYCLCFYVFWPWNFSQRLLYIPQLHGQTLVPLGLALMVLAGFSKRILRFTLNRPVLLRVGALSCFGILVIEGLRLKPMPALFVPEHEAVYLQNSSLGQFIQRHVPEESVLLVSDPFGSRFFTLRKTLRLTSAKLLQRYRPEFAVGLSREELEAQGYRIEPYLSYAGHPVWKIKWD